MATNLGQEEESDPLPDLLAQNPVDGTSDGMIYSDSLTEPQKTDCRQVLSQFQGFSLTPRQTTWCTHEVDTGDSLPVRVKSTESLRSESVV